MTITCSNCGSSQRLRYSASAVLAVCHSGWNSCGSALYCPECSATKYLAADTGVRGKHVDVCLEDHASTVEAGVRTAAVWVISSEEAWNKR